MPETALAATKEKRLGGRQWFESGRAAGVLHHCFSFVNLLNLCQQNLGVFSLKFGFTFLVQNQMEASGCEGLITYETFVNFQLAYESYRAHCSRMFYVLHRKVQHKSLKDLMKKMRKTLTSMMMKTLKVISSSKSYFPQIWEEKGKKKLFFFFFCGTDDEDDMLEHYLAEKTDSSSHSSRRGN